MARRLAVAYVVLAGCGRIAFDSISGASVSDGGDGDARDSGGGGDGGDGPDGPGVAPCSAHPMLGASGCLAGTGPYSLWVFREDTGTLVPDTSGRGCIPLQSAGMRVADGIKVESGAISSTVGDAAGLFGAVTAASGITLELWANTTVTPAGNVNIATIDDGGGTRTRVVQSTTFSGGVVEMSGTSIDYGTRDLRDGQTRHIVVRGNTTNVSYALSGFISSAGGSSTFSWVAATSSIRFGPWNGTVVRAAVYDRLLSNTEITCLNTAGALTIP
jgi:hypothetical protein